MTSDHQVEIDEALDLHLISIRLPKSLINNLKFIAKREGLGYQPLIRRLLVRFVNAEMRAIAMDQARSLAHDKEQQREASGEKAPHDCESEMPKMRQAC